MPDLEERAAGLTENEKLRLIYGRVDWRESEWQDHCGDLGCEHCHGYIPTARPLLLSDEDKVLRAHLTKDSPNAQ